MTAEEAIRQALAKARERAKDRKPGDSRWIIGYADGLEDALEMARKAK